MAAKDWSLGFVKRRSEPSLRSPKATSLARAVGFNRVQVGKFFTLLNQELGKHEVSRIFNVDESGITMVHKPGKVLAEVGCKQVGRMVSQEKGATTTVVCAASPSGVCVPPMMLFKQKNMNKNLMKGATHGELFHNNSYAHDDQGDNPGQEIQGSMVSSKNCDRCWHLN